MLDSIYKTWRWPRVVDKVEHDPKNPLEYAKIWRIAQQSAASGKPIKFGTCSAQVLAFFLDSHTDHYDLDDKKQVIWDMAEAMNLELRQLAASGCKVIQIEEPTLHFMARYYPNETELHRLPRRLLSTARSRASTTSRSGSTPAGATPTCRRCSRTSRTRTRWRSTWSA